MSFKIVATDNFERELKSFAKKYSSIKYDLEKLFEALEKNPRQGISLGKDCYKIRMAITSKGKGKSGGARIITHVYVSEKQVYLLSMYDKSQLESISNTELRELLKQLPF